MKLLLLTPQRPYPPHQGTTLRNFNVIKELAKRHTVCLLTFEEVDQTIADHDPLPNLCEWIETVPMPSRTTSARVRQLVTSRRPDMGWRLWSPDFAERLMTILTRESFDVVQIEAIEMAPYLPIIEALTPKPFIVYDAHNAEWVLQKRAFQTDARNPRRWLAATYSLAQWPKLWQYEADLLKRVDHIIAMSEPDKAALQQIVPSAPITVVPNGVDLQTYSHFTGEPIAYDLLFTGKMDFRPNIDAVLWFAQKVLPLIQAERPETTFAIVGQRPHARLDVLRDKPGITITGFVESVLPYLAGTKVYVAPLRVGGGTRLKLMEAMAMGQAIVSTSLGAEGFPVMNGWDILLADTPNEFAVSILSLLENPTRRFEIGQMGRIFAHAHYGWDKLIPQMEVVYPD